MKKLYRKGTVHPSPPPPSPSSHPTSDHHLLAFLPAAILTLTVALSPQDKEVLAYLISCSSSTSCLFPGNRKNTHKSSTSPAAAAAATTTTTSPAALTTRGTGGSSSGKSGDHPTQFNCNCFGCYMSYWVRWDASPNRQLIHEIIDAFEDSLVVKKEKNKKDRRKKLTTTTTSSSSSNSGGATELPDESTRSSENELTELNSVGNNSNEVGGEVDEGGEKGSVRKIVSFLGEKIWGVWT